MRRALASSLLLISTAVQAEDPTADLQQTHAEKSVLEARLSGLPEREQRLNAELTGEVRTLFRLRRGGMLPLFSGLDAMLGHASRMAHYEKLTRKTLRELEQVRGERERLSKESLALDAKLAAVEEAAAGYVQVQQQLVQEAVARQEAVAAPVVPQQTYGLSLAGGMPLPGERFTDQVGGLALPVAGAASISDSERPGDDGRGLKFEAQPGASVRAAAAGKVAFAERQSLYGLMVIVEHDHRYRTVYGGLSSIDVQVGDAISKSARIGSAGEAVYFEVRRDARSQDAR
ncbi:MAG TPA: peptidoglycan DD-metalloendopeptidase family protein, partial [Polyangiales bacterium]|nr:peptidoglycan DD-metalloendopeptidase family protein [Polyangiales bacterium]